jgi:hypothetical protein
MYSFTEETELLERSQRRLARFRRLVLFAFLLLVAAGGILGFRVWNRFSNHWLASQELDRLKMKVTWDPDSSSWWKGATNVVAVHNKHTTSPFTDADIGLLRQLDHLESLDLSRCVNVTEAGLQSLAGIKSLKELTLGTNDGSGPRVTDGSLGFLKLLPHLKILSLSYTKVTDAGLAQLEGLRELEILDLDGTSITDAGLVHLNGLKRLQQLSVHGTTVTSPGAIALIKSVPGLSVHQDGGDDVKGILDDGY